MSLPVLPRTGIGSVALNMTKDQVLTAMGKPDKEFYRSKFSNCLEWEWRSRGVFVAFDPQGLCIEVSAFGESDPVLEGVNLLRVEAAEAWSLLRRLDGGVYEDEHSLISKSLGVLIFAPHIEEDPVEPADMVTVFRPDYPGVQ